MRRRCAGGVQIRLEVAASIPAHLNIQVTAFALLIPIAHSSPTLSSSSVNADLRQKPSTFCSPPTSVMAPLSAATGRTGRLHATPFWAPTSVRRPAAALVGAAAAAHDVACAHPSDPQQPLALTPAAEAPLDRRQALAVAAAAAVLGLTARAAPAAAGSLIR